MNTIQLYIEENLGPEQVSILREKLLHVPYVTDVEISDKSPHEFVVEFEAQQNMPMRIITFLKQQGYHPDIFSA